NGGDVHPGRTFTRLEDLANDAVAVINTKLEEQLFRGRDPIDQTIHVAGASFKVIGVYVPPPNLFSGATPPFVGIPHGAFVKHVPYVKGLMRLAVAPAPAYTQQAAMDEVVATLRSLRGLKPGQENNFSIVTQDKLLDSWNKVSGMFFLVMLVLSSIGLIVGGVGVVAIMMISVTERTREIGVRKPRGATRSGRGAAIRIGRQKAAAGGRRGGTHCRISAAHCRPLPPKFVVHAPLRSHSPGPPNRVEPQAPLVLHAARDHRVSRVPR